jgi:hypothetical protein
LPLKARKHLKLENLNPAPEPGFKPLIFRPTPFDTSKKFMEKPKGTGKYSFFKVKGKRVLILRTDNYLKAFNFNLRALDFVCPEKTQIGSLTTVEFVKYKLLRSLENFTHFLTVSLADNPKYLTRLSRKLRYWLRDCAFKAAFRGIESYCKGKPTRKDTVSKPSVKQVRTLDSFKTKSKQNQVASSDEESDSSSDDSSSESSSSSETDSDSSSSESSSED